MLGVALVGWLLGAGSPASPPHPVPRDLDANGMLLFEGNTAFDSATLRSVIACDPQHAVNAVIAAAGTNESVAACKSPEDLAQTVAAFYVAQGYVLAKATAHAEQDAGRVTLSVTEGGRFHLGTISVVDKDRSPAKDQLGNPDDLKVVLGLVPGAPFLRSQILEGLRIVRTRYSEAGYSQPIVTPITEVKPGELAVNVTVEIERGMFIPQLRISPREVQARVWINDIPLEVPNPVQPEGFSRSGPVARVYKLEPFALKPGANEARIQFTVNDPAVCSPSALATQLQVSVGDASRGDFRSHSWPLCRQPAGAPRTQSETVSFPLDRHIPTWPWWSSRAIASTEDTRRSLVEVHRALFQKASAGTPLNFRTEADRDFARFVESFELGSLQPYRDDEDFSFACGDSSRAMSNLRPEPTPGSQQLLQTGYDRLDEFPDSNQLGLEVFGNHRLARLTRSDYRGVFRITSNRRTATSPDALTTTSRDYDFLYRMGARGQWILVGIIAADPSDRR